MKKPEKSTSAAVPVFALYGENEAIADPAGHPEFVHIELIATRSQRYDWEIATHAHRRLFQLLCLFEGGAQVRVDDELFEMRPAAGIVIPPGVVHSFRFLPGSAGYVLTVAESLLTEADAAQAGLFDPLCAGPRLVDLGSDESVARRVAALLEQILGEFLAQRVGRDRMFDWLVRALLLLVARQVAVLPLSGSARGRANLFSRFQRLVEAHFAEHWPVSRYAAGLNVTESRLNRLCQALTGKSAFDLVQDRLLLEAKRKLFYIAAPVSQLAYELGYADPAYFCRFFKKRTGATPSAFRQRRDAY